MAGPLCPCAGRYGPMVLPRSASPRSGVVALRRVGSRALWPACLPAYTSLRTEPCMPSLLTRFKTLAVAAPLAISVALPLVGVAHADERDFTVVNNSSATLTHLYVSPTSADAWGDDILGRAVMAPGE